MLKTNRESLFYFLIKKNKRTKEIREITKRIVKLAPKNKIEGFNYSGETIRLENCSITPTTKNRYGNSFSISEDHILSNCDFYLDLDTDFNHIFKQVKDQLKSCYEYIDNQIENEKSKIEERIQNFEYYTNNKQIYNFLQSLKIVNIRSINSLLNDFAVFLDCFEDIECEDEFKNLMNKIYNTDVFNKKENCEDYQYQNDYSIHKHDRLVDIINHAKFLHFYDRYSISDQKIINSVDKDILFDFIEKLTNYIFFQNIINIDEAKEHLKFFCNYIDENIKLYNKGYEEILYKKSRPAWTTAHPWDVDNHYRSMCGLPYRDIFND